MAEGIRVFSTDDTAQIDFVNRSSAHDSNEMIASRTAQKGVLSVCAVKDYGR